MSGRASKDLSLTPRTSFSRDSASKRSPSQLRGDHAPKNRQLASEGFLAGLLDQTRKQTACSTLGLAETQLVRSGLTRPEVALSGRTRR